MESKDPCIVFGGRAGVRCWQSNLGRTPRGYTCNRGAIGILRLRECCALRSTHFAQDDSLSFSEHADVMDDRKAGSSPGVPPSSE